MGEPEIRPHDRGTAFTFGLDRTRLVDERPWAAAPEEQLAERLDPEPYRQNATVAGPLS